MSLQRLTAAGILTLTVVGCARVREVFEPAQFIAAKHPPLVYVTQRSRAVLTIVNPRVSGDTLLGTAFGEDRPLAVPLSDVHSVSAVRVDGGRTALLAVGITAAAAISAYAFFGSANGQNNWYCDYTSGTRGPAGEPICGPASP